MAELVWNAPGQNRYKNGVDHGVIYLRDEDGEYTDAEVWNGLTTVTESPSGAESNKQYADNQVYVNIKSAEEYGATIEALYFPDKFRLCDGTAEPEPGVFIGQQARQTFGFCYRNFIGNDLTDQLGEEIHLVYGCDAAPSEIPHNTINDSPEAGAFSWEVTSLPHAVGTVGGVEYRPTAHITLDSTKVDPAKLADLKEILYGTVGDDPRLPMPSEVFAIVGTGQVDVDLQELTNQPSYNDTTHVITLPAVTGVQWSINGEDVASGAQPALGVGEVAEVNARATTANYNLVGDDEWIYEY